MLCALLDLHFRVGSFEVFIEKFQMAHDAQTVGNNPRFLCVTEMPIDILLFYGRIAGSGFRKQRGGTAGGSKVGSSLAMDRDCAAILPMNLGLFSAT